MNTIELAKKCGAEEDTWVERGMQLPERSHFIFHSPEELEAFRAACVEEAMKWRPIETAPKDESLFVIANFRDYSPPFVARGWWSNTHQCYKYTGGDAALQLTHWMPLPAAPEVK